MAPALTMNPAQAFPFRFQQQRASHQTGHVVYLVDPDQAVREAISELLIALGREVVSFGSGRDFLAYNRTDACACLILDLLLPDMTGLDLQRRLAEGCSPPIIFVSDSADIATTVRAMKAGAIEFLTKPVDPWALSAAIDAAFIEDKRRRQTHSVMATLRNRFALLTPREREVLPLVTGGLLNKQAAAELGISEVTLQVHRGQIMRKMAATSFAELVRMAEKLGISRPWC